MRTKLEIQKAHDLLTGFILGEIPRDALTTEQLDGLCKMATVLCWVLGDDHPPGEKFQVLLTDLEEHAGELGFRLERRNN